MRRAAQLLQIDAVAIGSIGAKVGYSSRSHFSKAFSEQFGMSPVEFRKQYQQQ